MRLILFLFFTISSFLSFAQQLKFKIDGLNDTTVFLGRYLGDRLYYADTSFSENGIVQFKKDNYKPGVYALICPGPSYFEFIMADKEVEMETTIGSFIPNMKVKKSIENKLFYGYIQFINQKKKQAESFKKTGEKDKLEAIDNEVKAYQRKIVSENKDKLIGKILNMSIDPVIPDEIIENDTLKYKFYLNHFWDNIDLGDARIVHSPVYHNKLNYFFKKLLIQHPDTICRYAHKILSKIEEGTDLFKYTVHFITYNFETSKIMGMDGVFVCMAKDYYCPPDNSKAFWLKKEKLDELCEKASALEPLLIGKMAPRIILADTSEKKWIDFYQLPNKYNLLIFWDPDCGHCKKEIPKLKKMYQELKDMNVDIEFIAVGTNLENDKWKKFISKNQLKWINLSDFPEANENPKKYLFEKRVTDLKSLNFRKTYDIFSTPQVYLLDANKKIIGKKLDALTFGNLLQQLEKIKIPYVQLLEKQKEEKEKEKKNNNVKKAD